MRALAREVGDGIIRAVDLYAVYVQMMATQGREPVSKSALGRAFTAAGQIRMVRWVNGKSAHTWTIRQQYLHWLTPEEP